MPPVDYNAARNMVGGGARALLERGLTAEGRSPPAAEVDRMVQEFIVHYSAHIADASQPFEGVETTLDALASQGFRLAVCTNKLEGLSVKLLRLLGLSRRFVAICGADTFGISKPDPRILLNTLAHAGGNPQQAVMVGDSITDIATARAAGVPVVAVDFGYSEMPVSQLAPDRVASHFADLPQLISELLAARQVESAGEA
jgi:phosphoglycolate phosphatase